MRAIDGRLTDQYGSSPRRQARHLDQTVRHE